MSKEYDVQNGGKNRDTVPNENGFFSEYSSLLKVAYTNALLWDPTKISDHAKIMSLTYRGTWKKYANRRR